MSEKIKIHEVNSSARPSSDAVSSDIVFIPGLTAKSDVTLHEPVLCVTLNEFKEAFGTNIPVAKSVKTEATAEEKDADGTVTKPATATVYDYHYDKNYMMAVELLNLGMPVLYAATATVTSTDTSLPTIDLSATTSDTHMEALVNKLKDRGETDVKYITPGVDKAYCDGTNTMHQTIADMAATRGDAVALIDIAVGETSIDADMTASDALTFSETNDKNYCALFYPKATYNLPTVKMDNVELPAYFGYLLCVAKAIKTGPNWLAMAGVNRGVVPYIQSVSTKNGLPVTNKIAEDAQPKVERDSDGNDTVSKKHSVNCITNIKPYGQTVWGNRTAREVTVEGGLDQGHFLNVRNMVSDIKKVLYSTAKTCMFEQNTDTLWLKFKGGVTPLLNQLKLGNALYDYKIIKTNFRTDGKTPLGRGELGAIVKIYPINTIEFFELSVEIADNDVAIN